MILLDLTHTSHTPARTGVQRVGRALLDTLRRQTVVEPVTYDPYRRHWRALEAWERWNLTLAASPTTTRRARWPFGARWRGRTARWLKREARPLPPATAGIVVPEIFSPAVARNLPHLFRAGGPRVALFHDAIALRLPEHTPRKTVQRFPAYLQELRDFDGVAAVSADSAAALTDYWRWLGGGPTPPVIALPLGLSSLAPPVAGDRAGSGDGTLPEVLCVGSVEGRKNHLALLEACELLWSRGARFQLRLIGLARPETARAALARLQALQATGRPLRFDGVADDATLAQAYATCVFTVYPSLMEGFGLPVLESLQHGRPCICSARGALGESARGGGCRVLAEVDAASLAAAIDRLLHNPMERDALAAEAAARRFRTWDDYSRDLLAWMAGLNATRTGRRSGS